MAASDLGAAVFVGVGVSVLVLVLVHVAVSVPDVAVAAIRRAVAHMSVVR